MYKVIGKMRGTFTSKENNEKISYAKIFLTIEQKSTDNVQIEGIVCKEFKCKSELLDSIKIGDNIDVFFNQYGSVGNFTVVK